MTIAKTSNISELKRVCNQKPSVMEVKYLHLFIEAAEQPERIKA